MIAQSVTFPSPFGLMDFISLTEPYGETEEELLFVHRLYLVTQFAEGGKVLLAQRKGQSIRKNLLAPCTEGG